MTIKHLRRTFKRFNRNHFSLKRLFVTTSCSLLLAMSFAIPSHGVDNQQLNESIKQLIRTYSQCLAQVSQTMPINSAETLASANRQCAAPLQQLQKLSPHAANQLAQQVTARFVK